ncbi:probable purine permease 21 [Sesamum indicum]|uniref:Probable purine permease n=1 Tax=Sesamum indicum TaxID=4182 RepID=A0A6I9TI76_SESIN|nr:probable purine permease 21 [Sesamum indicum]
MHSRITTSNITPTAFCSFDHPCFTIPQVASAFYIVTMEEIQEPHFRSIAVEEAQEQPMSSNTANTIPEYTIPQPKNKTRWAWMFMCMLFVLLGQSSATLLGRLYYNEGGNAVLLAALLETIGFPILIPFALYFSAQDPSRDDAAVNDQPSNLIRSAVYIFLGLFQAATGVLYSVGLQNLPVSTFSLISTTQLGFNALFSFFFNAQKLTPLILNSVVLLTISSTLLIFHSDSEQPAGKSNRGHFAVGFSCSLVASALYSLMLSMTQLAFQKVLKRETFSTVLNMIIYQSLAATCVVIVPLFISGEWSVLRNEMENFELGKVSYVIVLAMIAVAWQVCSIGAIGLIFEVSSLFTNVISTVGLPIVPILAAIFFHEKMDGIKVISVVLAVWGFASYVYQHYLNDSS